MLVAVEDERGVAMVALLDKAAGGFGAGDVVGEAAPVEEEDDLASVGEGLFDGGFEGRAEEVPTMTGAWPIAARAHALWRWEPVRPEWMTATRAAPKRRVNRSAVCGVRAISGTRTMADWPCARTSAMRRR